jgi:hypothetical protein
MKSDISKGFSTKQAGELSDIPVPTIGWLKKSGVRPSIRPGRAQGHASVWSLADVAALRAFSLMRVFGAAKCFTAKWSDVRDAAWTVVSHGKYNEEERLLVLGADGQVRLTETCCLPELSAQVGGAMVVVDLVQVAHEMRTAAEKARSTGKHLPLMPSGRTARKTRR